MRKSIVITSIFPPTEAIVGFSTLTDYNVIVVGDKKTPSDWQCRNSDFISVNQQEIMDYKLIKVLPYNHYCRKMIGYLEAIKYGADIIIDADDDNIPKIDWCFPDFEGDYDYIPDNKGFINIYELFTEQKIWPRGLPLDLITKKFYLGQDIVFKKSRVGVWQGLADDDPDVDAIYRLTSDKQCFFNQRPPVVLGKGTICPFNTQNSIIRKELYALLYLPTHVTFRFTDILRGLIAQPIMWLNDYLLGFVSPNVNQVRNPHNYMKDFVSEIPMYLNSERIIELVLDAIKMTESIEDNLYNAYVSLLPSGIICKEELDSLEAWLSDLNRVTFK